MLEGLDSVVDYGNKLTRVEDPIAKESGLDSPIQQTAASGIDKPPGEPATSESVALTAGGIAALLTGACCVAPLVLVSAGLGGAWLANFQLLEPYRPLFIALALVALGFAGWRIYRPAAECAPGHACAVPRIRHRYKIGFWIVAALLVGMLGFPYFAPLLF